MGAVASEASIRIVYDGEALRSGTMDVRDLAPALLALSDLFDETNKVLNGPDRAIHLRIRHDIKRGSFDIGLQVLQTWASKIVEMFAGDKASSAANLIEILGFAAGASIGLFKLIKWLKNRPVKRVELLDDGNVRLVVDGDELVITHSLAKVFSDLGIRRALAAFLAPLSREGIESFQAKTADGEIVDQVTSPELPAFEPPPPVETAPQQITVNTFKQTYTLVSITFKDGNKWRVSDGQNTINVTIEDSEFLQKVNSHDISFAKDDILRCEVRQVQTLAADGLKTEFFIARILDHQHTYRKQVLLPFERLLASPDEVQPAQTAEVTLPVENKVVSDSGQPKKPEAKKRRKKK